MCTKNKQEVLIGTYYLPMLDACTHCRSLEKFRGQRRRREGGWEGLGWGRRWMNGWMDG
jgi:hypothetical protein